MQVLRFLYANLKDRKGLFWFVFATAIVDGAFVNFMALSFGRISSTNFTENEQAILWSIIFLILSLFTSFIIRRFGETLALTTAELVRSRMIARLVEVPLLTLQKKHSGYVLSLVNRVADTLQPVMFNLYWWGARSIVFFVVICLAVLRQSAFILLVDVGLLAVFVLLSQWLSFQILKFNKVVNHTKSNFMSVFADFASNISTVKRLHLSVYMNKMVAKEKERVVWAVNRQQEFHAARWFMLHAVFALLFTVTFSLLLWQLNQHLLSVGNFVVLIWFFWGLRGDLNSLAENLKVYTELGGYIDQIEEVLTYEVLDISPGKTKTADSAILIENAIFAYPGSSIRLSVPHFELKKGEIAVITGPSGQGKSTLLHLMAGLMSPQEGTVSLGVGLDDIGIVSQEVELFNTTLRENITLGVSLYNKRLLGFMEELDLLKLVDTHPEGLDVLIGEKGLRLSTGQKQRVNILRAFIQNRSLILLDEPIAHLDPQTSTKTIAFIRKYIKDKTCVIVSHQPTITKLASRTFEMRRHILYELHV